MGSSCDYGFLQPSIHLHEFTPSPGVMMWAVVVPAFIIHTPPCMLLSGSPVDADRFFICFLRII